MNNMEAIDLLKIITQGLDDDSEIEFISPIMYDPDKFGHKVSVGVYQKSNDGKTSMKFQITVNDLTYLEHLRVGNSN